MFSVFSTLGTELIQNIKIILKKCRFFNIGIISLTTHLCRYDYILHFLIARKLHLFKSQLKFVTIDALWKLHFNRH
jgi:hypothetical protein